MWRESGMYLLLVLGQNNPYWQGRWRVSGFNVPLGTKEAVERGSTLGEASKVVGCRAESD